MLDAIRVATTPRRLLVWRLAAFATRPEAFRNSATRTVASRLSNQAGGRQIRNSKFEIRNSKSLLLSFFQSAKIPPFPLLWRTGASFASRRCRQPLHAAQLDLLLGWRRRVIGVELSGACPGYVRSLEFEHLDDASVAAPRLDDDVVARTNSPVWLSMVAVDLYPSAMACGLRLRAGLEETRHIEPDIQSNGLQFVHE